MAQSRAHVLEFANLPAYKGSKIATKERQLITDLTNLDVEQCIRGLDSNVEACLPEGCSFVAILPHGNAYWTRTAAISTTQDGKPRSFFLKLTCTPVGLTNLTGEYHSMQAIHGSVPGFCPVPLAVGTCAIDSNVHFYLASYVDMTDEVPDVDQLPPKVAEMHLKAVSPTGKFGFHVPTNMGACVQPNEWTSSWERCFTNLIVIQFKFEQQVHGETAEMQEMHDLLITKVIPRLLRPLETEGRSIQPRFVHGDLWDGNASVDASTDLPIIFDASGMYAHNEFELGAWNLPRHKIYKSYIKEYQRHFPPSAPEEDYEDRLLLYQYRFNITSSASYLDNMRFRELAIEDLRTLTTKYRDGYQGTAAAKSEV